MHVKLLRHFTPSEFGDWWDRMHPQFLKDLDNWRDQFGFPCEIPFAGRYGALGRTTGPKTSQHYVDINTPKKLRVADIQPYKWDRNRRRKLPLTLEEMRYGAELAERYFSGIGIYPQKLRPMFHLDQRPNAGAPFRWGQVKQDSKEVYVAWETAWDPKYWKRS